VYPGSVHVRQINLQTAADEAVWQHAANAGLAIVTKDDDFRQRGFVRGAPPKVIWVHLGNCTTDEVEAVLRARHTDIVAFVEDPGAALLVLTRAA
jgi:predicted nuclease of predicted toxin-antitoxin system